MCFGPTLSYQHKEFLNPRPPRTRKKYNTLPPRSKFNPHPPGASHTAVHVPALALQMRVHATRAG